jgi:hypothetical protein
MRGYKPNSHSATSKRNHNQPSVAVIEAVIKTMFLSLEPAAASLSTITSGGPEANSRSDDEDRSVETVIFRRSAHSK